MQQIKVLNIESHKDKLKDVLLLHRQNTSTLGFLPEAAFFEHLKKNQIVIAIDENNSLLGYLLYSINQRGNFIYIVHLCVRPESRRMGVADEMVNYLVAQVKQMYTGIRVTCREDYKASKIWKKLGFTCEHEKMGRRKKGSILFVWWMEFNHPNLFTGQYIENDLRVALDSNVIYEQMEAITDNNIDSHSLRGDWLIKEVKYFITPELKNDIINNTNPDERKKARKYIGEFSVIRADREVFISICNEIKTMLAKKLSPRDEADIRHLAWVIASGTDYFLTKDSDIIKLSNEFYKKYKINIHTPAEFILNIDSLQRPIEYQPNRFAGSRIIVKRPDVSDIRKIADLLFYPKQERKKDFRKVIDSSSQNQYGYLIKSEKEVYVYYSYIITEENDLKVISWRHIKTPNVGTILNQVIYDILLKAIKERLQMIIIDEPFVSEALNNILKLYGFIRIDRKYYKYVKKHIIPINELIENLRIHIREKMVFEHYKDVISKVINNGNYDERFYYLEKFMWPMKISDTGLPCYLIPIKPFYSMNLFNTKLSEQDLFGGDEELLFRRENIYYRSSVPKCITSPSRALWYVSKDKNKPEDTMLLYGTSYIDHVEIEKPKILFKKYEKYGIYEWKDLFRTAKYDLNNDIMAFRFELVEEFIGKIKSSEADSIWNKIENKKFTPPQCPCKITETLYFEIYKNGMQLNEE